MDLKKRFKLYKAKKNWLLAGITTLGVLFGSTVLASAATPTTTTAPVAATQTAPVTATSAVSDQAPANASAAKDSSAPVTQTAAPTTATTPSKEQAAPVTKEVNLNGHWYLQDQQTGQNLHGWQNLSGNRVVYYDPKTD